MSPRLFVWHSRMQGGLVPFDIGVPVLGDVTIAIWFGEHNLGERLYQRPALAYAFHTAFAETGVDRVSIPKLDVANSAFYGTEVVKR